MYLLKNLNGYIETDNSEYLNQDQEYIYVEDLKLREIIRNSYPLIKIVNNDVLYKERPVEKEGYDLIPNMEAFEWEYEKIVIPKSELEQRLEDVEVAILESMGVIG